MNPDDYKKLKEIFQAALELPPAERRQFLDASCSNNPSLRVEAERLLNSYDSEYLEKPAGETIARQVSDGLGPGELVGHYTILNKIGAGGMGEVYLAEDGKLGRKVAIKLLPETFTEDADRLRRFEQEARTASALNHPNILTIHEIGDTGNARYIATEYIDGETLRARVNRGRLSVSEALDIAVQCASALSAAHENGIIHRDIKPENIMLRRDNLVKVLDFGLAKLLVSPSVGGLGDGVVGVHDAPTEKHFKTAPGMIMGTVQYMSPEQTRGHATDARTDIWSLGIVLYEMLTGEGPFKGENAADLIAEIVKTQPAPLSQFVADIPERLDEIVSKTLKKIPNERYQTADDLLGDINQLKRNLDLKSEIERSDPRIPFSGSAVKSARNGSNVTRATLEDVSSVKFILAGIKLHKRAALGILALIATALGTTAYVARTYWRNPIDPNDTRLFDSLHSVRLASWKSGSGSPYTDYRASHNGTMIAYTSTQEGGNEGIYVKQTADGEELRVTKDTWQNHNPIWSPDDQRIAFVSRRENQSGIYICPSLGGPSVAVKLIGEENIYLRDWSADRTAIFYELKGNLFRLNLETRETVRITSFDDVSGRVRYFSLSPKEDMIAYCDKTGVQDDLWLMPIAGGEPRRITNDKDEEINPRWHPDGKRILFNVYRGDFSQINVAHVDGRPPDQVTRGEGKYELIDVAADGTRIFYFTWEKRSGRSGVKTETGEGFDLSTEVHSEFWAEVSPDGNSIVFQTNPAPHLTTYLHESSFVIKSLADQTARFSLKGYNPRWLPDGRHVAFVRWDVANQNYQLWMVDTANGQERQISMEGVSPPSTSMMPINRGEIGEFHFSPNRNAFVYLDSRRQNIYSAAIEAAETVNLTGNKNPGVRYFSPLWSPVGDRIVYLSMGRAAEKPQTPVWKVWLSEQGESRNIFSAAASLRLLGWSETGSELFFAMTDGPMKSSPLDVQLLRVPLAGQHSIGSTHKNVYANSIALSADTKMVVFVARNNDKDDIWTAPLRGQPRKITTNSSTRIFFGSPTWSPDGKTIYFDKQEAINTISMFENFK